MASSMISVRIPSSLVDELKDVSKKDHFMDLSEAVRSIIRAKWIAERDPIAYKLEKLREEIASNISRSSDEALLQELERIRTSIIEAKRSEEKGGGRKNG